MARDEFGDGDLEPEEFDPVEVETTDGAWENAGGPRHGGGLGRWVLLLLVIAVVAVVVHQLQPSNDSSASPTPTDQPTTSATTEASGGRTGAVLEPPATAGQGPVIVQGSTPRMTGIPGRWSLYALAGGAVVRLDFTRDRVVAVELPSLASTGPMSLLATDEGVIVRPLDFVPGYLVPDGAAPRELSGALDHGGPAIPGPDPHHVWVMVGEGDDTRVELVTPDGRRDGPSIPLPANAQGWIRSDGGGHPLVDTIGGVYVVKPDGLRRVTTGVVLAVGPTGWLVVECDDQNRCSRVVVDRASGDRHVLPGAIDGRAPGYFVGAGVVAPDGSAAAFVDTSEEGGPDVLRVVDLRTGDERSRPIGPLSGESGALLAWSPDSSRLIVTETEGPVLVVDPSEVRRRVTLGIDIPDVVALAVRSEGA